MLFGKDRRRHHQSRLTPRLQRDIDRRGGADRLSASDVADQDAAHRGDQIALFAVTRHIGVDLVDRALLRSRQFVGQFGEQGREGRFPTRARQDRFTLTARERHPKSEQQQFVKDQPPQRRLQLLAVFRVVERPRREREGGEPVFEPDRFGQGVGERRKDERERRFDHPAKDLLRDRLGQRVDREIIGERRPLLGSLVGGRGELTLVFGKRQRAVEAEGIPDVEHVAQIGLIEEDRLRRTRLVEHAELGQGHPPAQTRVRRHRRHGQKIGVFLPVPPVGKPAQIAAILIGAREMPRDVEDGDDPRRFQRLGARVSHAVQDADARTRTRLLSHGTTLPSFFLLCILFYYK